MRNLTKIFALLLVAFFTISATQAAEPYFKALGKKGSVYLKKDGRTSWENVYTGYKFFPGDMLKVNKNSGVVLSYIKGDGIVELNSTGVYNVKDLVKKVEKKNIYSVLAGYIKSEMGEVDNILSSDDYQNRMSVTGAVARGLCAVSLFSPETSLLAEPNIEVSWYKYAVSEGQEYEYELLVMDDSGNQIFSKKTLDTTMSVDLSEFDFKRGDKIKWTVMLYVYEKIEDELFIDTCKAPVSTISWITSADEKNLNSSMSDFISSYSGALNPMQRKVVEGKFYEVNGFWFDALNSYKNAVSAAKQSGDEDQVRRAKNIYMTMLYKMKRSLETETE